MAARSLNRVQLIGNLTRDPELRYTPQGTAVCTFGVATNREWTTESGEKRDEADFHNVVSWNKLAELCSQLLSKGAKVYVEGRLSTRSWTGQDGVNRKTTEVVISEMILLNGKRDAEGSSAGGDEYSQAPAPEEESQDSEDEKKGAKKSSGSKKQEDVNPDDIPF